MNPDKLLCVVGARPNFMKIAPIMRALAQTSIQARLIHTGQHYDVAMNQQFFEQLGIPHPDEDLEVGSGSHAQQTAAIMQGFEAVLDREQPRAILVVGDVNSTIACALVAAKKGVVVIHVEAGLRSYDRRMPEEINRVLTDQLSDFLFTTEAEALDNLSREGIDPERVHFVGNVMIDTLKSCLDRAIKPSIPSAWGDGYGLLTLHRPSNVDDPAVFGDLLQTLGGLSQQLPLVFPIHPRTQATMERHGLEKYLPADTVMSLPPQGYLEMLGLMASARVVLTDSGGIQEETTALGVPCITLRENTERPITVTAGTNTVVGRDQARIRVAFNEVLASGGKAGRIPPLWDGQAAQRIATVLEEWFFHSTTGPSQ